MVFKCLFQPKPFCDSSRAEKTNIQSRFYFLMFVWSKSLKTTRSIGVQTLRQWHEGSLSLSALHSQSRTHSLFHKLAQPPPMPGVRALLSLRTSKSWERLVAQFPS